MKARTPDWVMAVVVAVAVVNGFWGLVITFSDHPPNWSTWQSIVYVVSSHLPGAFIIGAVYPARWYLAIAVTWGAGMLMLADTMWYAFLLLLVGVTLAGFLGKVTTNVLRRTRRSP
jgi:hypothetical protein